MGLFSRFGRNGGVLVFGNSLKQVVRVKQQKQRCPSLVTNRHFDLPRVWLLWRHIMCVIRLAEGLEGLLTRMGHGPQCWWGKIFEHILLRFGYAELRRKRFCTSTGGVRNLCFFWWNRLI